MRILQTQKFSKWLLKLRDRVAKQQIIERIDSIRFEGKFGQFKSLGNDLFELKINAGKGYRIYYTLRNNQAILLLLGGDKQNKKQQQIDIKTARIMIDKLQENDNE